MSFYTPLVLVRLVADSADIKAAPPQAEPRFKKMQTGPAQHYH